MSIDIHTTGPEGSSTLLAGTQELIRVFRVPYTGLGHCWRRTPWWGVFGNIADPVIGTNPRASHPPHHEDMGLDTTALVMPHSPTPEYPTYWVNHYSGLAPQDHTSQGYHEEAYQHPHSDGFRSRPHRALILLLLMFNIPCGVHARRPPRAEPQGPVAPGSLTQDHGTYVTKNAYGALRSTHIDANTIRQQPAAAKAAHGLSIITMNVTSWNTKVYQYVASLHHDVIFIQEHRKTMASQIKVPKGYKMIFSRAHVTGTKVGGTLNTSGG